MVAAAASMLAGIDIHTAAGWRVRHNPFRNLQAPAGQRRGLNWNAGGGWRDGTPATFPDWLQVTFRR